MSPDIEKTLEHKERIRKWVWKTLPETIQAKERFIYAVLSVNTNLPSRLIESN